MNKFLTLMAVVCSPLVLSPSVYGDEPSTKKEEKSDQPKEELHSPFNMMSPEEQKQTGIKKLSGSEQDALCTWMQKQKTAATHHPISKEVTITSIMDEGKRMMLSDGTAIGFSSSARKKTTHWAVGDKLGIGSNGRKGSLTLYHLASGQKVKAKRDQAPKNDSGETTK